MHSTMRTRGDVVCGITRRIVACPMWIGVCSLPCGLGEGGGPSGLPTARERIVPRGLLLPVTILFLEANYLPPRTVTDTV